VPAGDAEVECRLADAHGVRRAASKGAGEVRCAVELSATACLEGVVLERGTGAPIGGAIVGNERSGVGPVFTDAAGRFTLDGIGYGDAFWSLAAHAPGFASEYRMVRVPAGADPRTLRFELERAVRAHGRVLDAARRPLGGARLSFLAQLMVPPMTAEIDRKETRADPLGRFEVELVPGATYRVLVSAAGRLLGTPSTPIVPAGHAALDLGELVLGETGSIAGTVAGDLAQQPCLVRLHCADGETWRGGDPLALLAATRPDPDGRFVFEPVPPGRYRLVLHAGGERTGSWSRPLVESEVELAPGERRIDVTLDPAAPCITGQVLDPDGKPVESAYVRLFALEGSGAPLVLAHTRDDGRFRVFPSAPGPYRIEVEDLRLFLAARTLAPVAPVESGDAELRIELAAFTSPHRIRGRLAGADGAEVKDLCVRFLDAGTGLALQRVAFIDADGWFELRNLRDTPYDLELLDFDGRFEPARLADVRPGDAEVELAVRARP
jgi:hypothetical protein